MSERVYDLYGSKTLSLNELRDAVEATTGIAFERRNSDYLGGDYFRGGEVGAEEFVIQGNLDQDGEVIENDFVAFAALLRIDRSPKADELREVLRGVADLEFLRRTTL